MKRLVSSWLMLCVLCSLLAGTAWGAACPEGKQIAADFVRNSDSEAANDGVCWYVDTMGDGCLMAARPAAGIHGCDVEPETVRLTDWRVDQVLYWEGKLLVSAGERLLTLAPNSGEVLEVRSFEKRIDRFAVSADALFVLTGGSVLRIADLEQTVVCGGVTRFWLEQPDRLAYMYDEQTIHKLTLSTGAVADVPNLITDLGDVPIYRADHDVCAAGYTTLRQKFLHGKFWNHMPYRGTGMTYNNQNGWTSIPCSKHNNYCGTAYQTCNGYAPNGKELSYQCWGFADKLGYDATGVDPQNLELSGGWKKLWYSSSLNSLKAGDILRYNKYGNSKYAHSIYVTAVNGDTITYADCNYDGTCVIRWGQTISKSTIRSWFVFLLSAPSVLSTQPTYQLQVDACLDGENTETEAGCVSFDVWCNGAAYRPKVSEFREYLPSGTGYEIRNVQPAPGVLYDETSSLNLSGTVTADRKVVLKLDHYYLNSAGQPVKTGLRDLPLPGSWAYQPVCWALETGISSGVSATCFAPNASCTRAQIVTFLWAAADRPSATTGKMPFADVDSGAYNYQPLRWAVEQGFTSGKSRTSFAPNDVCTRAEVITFLWSAAGRPAPELPETSPFSDVPQNAYYYLPVLWASQQGVTAGTGADAFSPNETCTRAQILTFLRAASQAAAAAG